MSLALGCNLAVASAQTRFNFAYTDAGTTADLGGSWHLPRIVGLRSALPLPRRQQVVQELVSHPFRLLSECLKYAFSPVCLKAR